MSKGRVVTPMTRRVTIWTRCQVSKDRVVASIVAKDGNGDPIPDSPRGILPLGDGDGGKFIPTGMDLVEKWSP